MSNPPRFFKSHSHKICGVGSHPRKFGTTSQKRGKRCGRSPKRFGGRNRYYKKGLSSSSSNSTENSGEYKSHVHHFGRTHKPRPKLITSTTIQTNTTTTNFHDSFSASSFPDEPTPNQNMDNNDQTLDFDQNQFDITINSPQNVSQHPNAKIPPNTLQTVKILNESSDDNYDSESGPESENDDNDGVSIDSSTLFGSNTVAEERVRFDSTNILDSFICPICTQVMVDTSNVLLSNCCYSLFCKSCIRECLTTNNECPKCRSISPKVESLEKKNFIQSMFLALRIQCPNTSNGCQVESQFSTLMKHVDVCQFEMIPCIYCKNQQLRKNLETHTEECHHRPIRCRACDMKVPQKLITSGAHSFECSAELVKCPVCQIEVLRRDMSKHILDICGK